MKRVDAHQHFWKVARGDYGWLTPSLTPLYRDFGPGELAPKLRAAGIDGTVLVQAAATAAETEFLLAIADRCPFVLGVVGWVDFESRDAPDALAALAAHPKLAGVRPMIQDVADDAWMLKRELAPAFRALVEFDLAFDALVKPRHLRHLALLVERHPELRVVVDHGAKPEIAAGSAWSGFGAWSEGLRELARSPRVSCKLSGLVTEARADWSVESLRPFAGVLLRHFGPSRLMWGSDWPVVDLAGGYERWWNAANSLLRDLTPAEHDAVLGGNAAAFYRLGARAEAKP